MRAVGEGGSLLEHDCGFLLLYELLSGHKEVSDKGTKTSSKLTMLDGETPFDKHELGSLLAQGASSMGPRK